MKDNKGCGCKAKRDAENIINNIYGNNKTERKYNKRSKTSGYLLKLLFKTIEIILICVLLIPSIVFSLLFVSINKKPIIIKKMKK